MTYWIIPLFVTGADAVLDVRKKEIFPVLTILSAAAGEACILLETKCVSAELITALVPGMLLLLISFLSGERIGRGDALAVLCIGAWVGMFPAFEILFLSLFGASLFSIILWAFRRKNAEIPFVPFLFAAMITARFFQPA